MESLKQTKQLYAIAIAIAMGLSAERAKIYAATLINLQTIREIK